MESKARTWFALGIMIVLVVGLVIFGMYLYGGRRDISEMNVVNTQKLAETETQNDIQNDVTNEIIETVATSTKLSPNAIIIEKRYYTECDHLIRETVDIPEELINQGEEELRSVYFGWNVEKYSPSEVIVYKEFKGICNEHYVIKEHEGVLGVYIQNNDGLEEWLEDTEIEVQYLPEDDVEKFKVGVKVVGKMNLSTFLEDYE